MLASVLIGFREALEAALIIGIILAYLIKTKKEKYNNVVYMGITVAIIASIITAILFNVLAGGFEGRAEEIFEGIAMFLAAGILTYMIIWMSKQRNIASDLRQKVSKQLDNGQRYGLFFLSFITVFREGVETVLFLGAAKIVGESENNLVGALIGIMFAVFIGYLMFVGSKHIKIKKFFSVTSLLLMLFAAGLLAHGVHEFQEASIIPIVQEHVWDINPAINTDGSYPLLHEKGVVGSLLKGLLGYNGNPNLLEVIIWMFYLIGMLAFYYKK
ncbi:MAG: FTR1 family protein [DPANN group archaeon]|nr:FTR1 family protein [DPANN group archaeon]